MRPKTQPEARAETAFDAFMESYGVKYEKAAPKDRNQLLASYNFPAEQWKHLRSTTNPIESTFATVRRRGRAEELARLDGHALSCQS